MQIRLFCGLERCWNDFHGVENLSIYTKNTSVGDLVEKLEDFIFFRLELC